MKNRLILLAALACLLLCGCSWLDGSYLSVKPHQGQNSAAQSKDRSASNYVELRAALEDMITSGVESAVINVAQYREDLVDEGIANAVLYVTQRYPLGAWAVEQIDYEVGTGAGQPAVSVNISYLHGRSEIRKIKNAGHMEQATKLIAEALEECSDSVVLMVENYQPVDFVQIVDDYMKENPNAVIELPEVAVGIYPEAGINRILEIKFTYETSRESLRQMQQQVRRVFASASLYINSDATDAQKFDQLYTFLMERFDYEVQTSITPAYSLLSHGVGDCEAFAVVYAAMCRQAGLNCQIVSGTREGEPRYWNLIQENGVYYHLDLLQSSDAGHFRKMTEAEMQGYVWDYSAYTGEEAE